jgi:hypothetical protein
MTKSLDIDVALQDNPRIYMTTEERDLHGTHTVVNIMLWDGSRDWWIASVLADGRLMLYGSIGARGVIPVDDYGFIQIMVNGRVIPIGDDRSSWDITKALHPDGGSVEAQAESTVELSKVVVEDDLSWLG